MCTVKSFRLVGFSEFFHSPVVYEESDRLPDLENRGHFGILY